MSVNNNQFYEILKTQRPELSESSLKTYTSILYNLYLKIYKEDPIKPEKFNNVSKTLKALEGTPINVRKTILSSLYVLTNKKAYKDAMLKDIEEYNKTIDKQEKTETQKNNWLDKDTLLKRLTSLKKKATQAYKDEDKGGYQDIQNYVLLCLLSGEYIPPRRAKDYTEFKIRNINPKTDNYIKGNKLYFNLYKGYLKKGLQVVEIPVSLKTILSKWIKTNPNDYLLFDKNNNKLSSTTLTQRLNKIFGSKISVNALRHTYLTDKHKDTVGKIDDLKKDMEMMGSSLLQVKTYIKND